MCSVTVSILSLINYIRTDSADQHLLTAKFILDVTLLAQYYLVKFLVIAIKLTSKENNCTYYIIPQDCLDHSVIKQLSFRINSAVIHRFYYRAYEILYGG